MLVAPPASHASPVAEVAGLLWLRPILGPWLGLMGDYFAFSMVAEGGIVEGKQVGWG
jgi:hypothetical protein